MAFLEVNNLTKRFGDLAVLRGINFSLERGQVLSLIGSSGSGKTTLLRCLNFLETPDSGTVTVGGHATFDAEAPKLSRREMRDNQLKFGLVFQSFNLFPQHSIRKNLTLAASLIKKEELHKQKASHAEISAAMAAIDAQAEDILGKVGLSDKADSYPFQLSGGQSQRAAIARALMLSPDILCFDEPTSALDPEMVGEVLELMKELSDDGMTMVVVTHEIGFACEVADRMVFMDHGKIEAVDTPEKLMKNSSSPRIREFFSKILNTY